MKIIGIIGGIGPESTIEYYRLILSLYREQKVDGNNPAILINSINLKRVLDLVGANKLQEATRYVTDEVERLACAGASFAVIASNTPHIIFDEIQANSTIPLISIVEETRKHAASLGLRRIGLFGTTFTMRGSFYQRAFDKEAIAVITPSVDEQNYIHEKYMTELLYGVVLEETKEALLKIVARLKRDEKIQGLILGGTELSLILSDGDDLEIPFLDTTRIHAESAVRELLKYEQEEES
ncbi:MAG TPA: amino acid racemase [Pyrinomonadaceae bacterium]|nr:amino acid racemase [Pyrinomonadaceae bacterium]